MSNEKRTELRRRSLVKSLLWRVIGVLWTWIGAYIILLLIPPSRTSAALIATLIVAYHHSTRMVMYYGYERLWSSISWGRDERMRPMSKRDWIGWAMGTIAGIMLVFYLIICVSPKIKAKQSGGGTGKDMASKMQVAVPADAQPQKRKVEHD
jgi:uncharacterized membrane protein